MVIRQQEKRKQLASLAAVLTSINHLEHSTGSQQEELAELYNEASELIRIYKRNYNLGLLESFRKACDDWEDPDLYQDSLKVLSKLGLDEGQ